MELQRETVQGKARGRGLGQRRRAGVSQPLNLRLRLRLAAAGSRALEVLRRDLVEELAELLDLVLLLGRDRRCPASSSTSSAQKIGVPVRSASAIESDGPGADLDAARRRPASAKKMPSCSSVIRTSVSSLPVALEHVLEQVVGQRPRRHDALLGERDRGGLDRADPDRQVALARRPRAAARSGWFEGISTRTPTTSTSRTSSTLLPAATPRRPAGAGRGSAAGASRSPALTSVGVQPHGQRRDLADGLLGAGPRPRRRAAAHAGRRPARPGRPRGRRRS